MDKATHRPDPIADLDRNREEERKRKEFERRHATKRVKAMNASGTPKGVTVRPGMHVEAQHRNGRVCGWVLDANPDVCEVLPCDPKDADKEDTATLFCDWRGVSVDALGPTTEMMAADPYHAILMKLCRLFNELAHAHKMWDRNHDRPGVCREANLDLLELIEKMHDLSCMCRSSRATCYESPDPDLRATREQM